MTEPSSEPKAMITYDDFAKLDLRVAKVLSVIEHPNADKLLVIDVDIGGQTRQIVAGLRPYIPAESLVGKNVIVVANLEPRKMRGIDSNGMLLAASWLVGEDRKLVTITTDGEAPSGAAVT